MADKRDGGHADSKPLAMSMIVQQTGGPRGFEN
jgi:hypothetical protein